MRKDFNDYVKMRPRRLLAYSYIFSQELIKTHETMESPRIVSISLHL